MSDAQEGGPSGGGSGFSVGQLLVGGLLLLVILVVAIGLRKTSDDPRTLPASPYRITPPPELLRQAATKNADTPADPPQGPLPAPAPLPMDCPLQLWVISPGNQSAKYPRSFDPRAALRKGDVITMKLVVKKSTFVSLIETVSGEVIWQSSSALSLGTHPVQSGDRDIALEVINYALGGRIAAVSSKSRLTPAEVSQAAQAEKCAIRFEVYRDPPPLRVPEKPDAN